MALGRDLLRLVLRVPKCVGPLLCRLGRRGRREECNSAQRCFMKTGKHSGFPQSSQANSYHQSHWARWLHPSSGIVNTKNSVSGNWICLRLQVRRGEAYNTGPGPLEKANVIHRSLKDPTMCVCVWVCARACVCVCVCVSAEDENTSNFPWTLCFLVI
jgi:hypothetical protein